MESKNKTEKTLINKQSENHVLEFCKTITPLDLFFSNFSSFFKKQEKEKNILKFYFFFNLCFCLSRKMNRINLEAVESKDQPTGMKLR